MDDVKEEKKTVGKKNTNKSSGNNKKNNNSKLNSSNRNSTAKKKGQYNKNNSSLKKKDDDIEEFDKTNSFDIIIDEGRLKDKDSLDFSFVDGKRKKKRAKEEIEILEEVDYKEEAKKIDIPIKENKSNEAFLTFLIIVFSFVLGFLFCFILGKERVLFAKTDTVVEKVTDEKIVIDDNYVFVGDSIFARYDLEKYYDGMPVINSGISGNKSLDILNDMDDRIYKYNPSKVILMIGTNDFRSISSENTVKNIGKIIDGIKENRPYAEIYVQSIYPVNKNINDGVSVGERNNIDIDTMNTGIKEICKEKKVTYMNIHDLLIDDVGNLKEDYTSDGLHLNEEAYKIITDEVMKILIKTKS